MKATPPYSTLAFTVDRHVCPVWRPWAGVMACSARVVAGWIDEAGCRRGGPGVSACASRGVVGPALPLIGARESWSRSEPGTARAGRYPKAARPATGKGGRRSSAAVMSPAMRKRLPIGCRFHRAEGLSPICFEELGYSTVCETQVRHPAHGPR